MKQLKNDVKQLDNNYKLVKQSRDELGGKIDRLLEAMGNNPVNQPQSAQPQSAQPLSIQSVPNPTTSMRPTIQQFGGANDCFFEEIVDSSYQVEDIEDTDDFLD